MLFQMDCAANVHSANRVMVSTGGLTQSLPPITLKSSPSSVHVPSETTLVSSHAWRLASPHPDSRLISGRRHIHSSGAWSTWSSEHLCWPSTWNARRLDILRAGRQRFPLLQRARENTILKQQVRGAAAGAVVAREGLMFAVERHRDFLPLPPPVVDHKW
jgi:hypothetical protein